MPATPMGWLMVRRCARIASNGYSTKNRLDGAVVRREAEMPKVPWTGGSTGSLASQTTETYQPSFDSGDG